MERQLVKLEEHIFFLEAELETQNIEVRKLRLDNSVQKSEIIQLRHQLREGKSENGLTSPLQKTVTMMNEEREKKLARAEKDLMQEISKRMDLEKRLEALKDQYEADILNLQFYLEREKADSSVLQRENSKVFDAMASMLISTEVEVDSLHNMAEEVKSKDTNDIVAIITQLENNIQQIVNNHVEEAQTINYLKHTISVECSTFETELNKQFDMMQQMKKTIRELTNTLEQTMEENEVLWKQANEAKKPLREETRKRMNAMNHVIDNFDFDRLKRGMQSLKGIETKLNLFDSD